MPTRPAPVAALPGLASFVTLILLLSQACTGGLCANDVLGTYPAPSGQYEAILFVRNCGATTPFGTNVSVLRPGDQLGDEAGNIFLVAAAPSSHVATNRIGAPLVEVRWLTGDTLLIRHSAGVEIHRQVLIERGVHVRYAALP